MKKYTKKQKQIMALVLLTTQVKRAIRARMIERDIFGEVSPATSETISIFCEALESVRTDLGLDPWSSYNTHELFWA